MPRDAQTLDNLTSQFKQKNRPFKELMLDLVSDPNFSFRMEEAP
jgi:hypothetical protein